MKMVEKKKRRNTVDPGEGGVLSIPRVLLSARGSLNDGNPDGDGSRCHSDWNETWCRCGFQWHP